LVTQAFLTRIAADVRREIAAASKLDGQLIERDIAARRHEANGGRLWAAQRSRIQKELEKLAINEADWCKQHLGCSIQTMLRRRQLAKGWTTYERRRKEAGTNGQFGILYALSLIGPEPRVAATNSHRMRVRSGSARDVLGLDLTRCSFITGEALAELRKMKSQSVSVIVTSPPYWPAKRNYGGFGIGFEPTLEEYIVALVAIFSEARRVMKDGGVMWIVIDDSYSGGDLLFIPTRLAMALQDDGWICRAEIVWDKGVMGRKESVTNRPRRNFEKVLMFTKQAQYFYDLDPAREPLSRPFTTPGKHKAGLNRHDSDRNFRVYANPMGRIGGSVWHIPPANYRGKHAATFPPELVRRMLAASCDEKGIVLDPMGGAGTVALVALQMGFRAITIDLNPDYTEEARQRISNAPAQIEADDDDSQSDTDLMAAE
jgi:DNA modification methylase